MVLDNAVLDNEAVVKNLGEKIVQWKIMWRQRSGNNIKFGGKDGMKMYYSVAQIS